MHGEYKLTMQMNANPVHGPNLKNENVKILEIISALRSVIGDEWDELYVCA